MSGKFKKRPEIKQYEKPKIHKIDEDVELAIRQNITKNRPINSNLIKRLTMKERTFEKVYL
jgi:hypothetical protein